VLQTSRILPPGLYGMEITESEGKDGEVEYEVEFREHGSRRSSPFFNRFSASTRSRSRRSGLSEFNQRAYELFAQPLVQAMSNDTSAKLLRSSIPCASRTGRCRTSIPGHGVARKPGGAGGARSHTASRSTGRSHPLRSWKTIGSELVSASLDLYRGMRDATTEAGFFSIYANMYLALPGRQAQPTQLRAPAADRANCLS
jgi:hypothetical protein